MNPSPPNESTGQWFWRNSKLTWPSFFVYLAPLALGMAFPGESINDPEGWVGGFWRYTVVAVLVALQLFCFAVGWLRSSTLFQKVIAALYIVVICFYLARNYFFGIEANWWACILLFFGCFAATVFIDGQVDIRKQSRRRSD